MNEQIHSFRILVKIPGCSLRFALSRALISLVPASEEDRHDEARHKAAIKSKKWERCVKLGPT